MKTFLLIAFCILNLQNNLQAFPQSELIDQPYNECEILQTEIKTIRNILAEKLPDFDNINENQQASCDNVKTDIEDLGTTLTDLLTKKLDQPNGSSNEEIIELIKEKNEILDKKIFALDANIVEVKEFLQAQNSKNAMIDELNGNVKEMLQKLSETQAQSKQLEQNNDEAVKILATKFEQQETELKNLKVQNEKYAEQLNELKELLTQQTPQFRKHTEKIESLAQEKHENLASQLKNLNATFIDHLGKQIDKLNDHENLLKGIKEENAKTQTEFGDQCTKCDGQKQLIESLIQRFDDAKPIWENFEKSSNETKGESCETYDIEVHVI